MSNIEVIYTGKEATTEQIFIDAQNQINKCNSKNLAIIFKDNNGHYQSFTTDMHIEELSFLGTMLQRRAEKQLE